MTRAIALGTGMSWAEATELPAEEALFMFRDVLRDKAALEYEQALLRHAILMAAGAQDLKPPQRAEY